MADTPTPSAWIKNWKPEVNLKTPAGEMLDRIVELVPEGSTITIFGSAPLQICLDGKFLSGDVDCMGPEGFAQKIHEVGLDDDKLPLYVQVSDKLNFRTHPYWFERAHSHSLKGRTILIPHPVDILIGKLNRLDDKDLLAFKMVREKTGHPTEDELIHELQGAVDLFRPGFDEEKAQDMKTTTRLLWRAFFGKDINVAEAIIAPAQALRQAGYTRDEARTNYKADLKLSAGKPPLPEIPRGAVPPRIAPQGDQSGHSDPFLP